KEQSRNPSRVEKFFSDHPAPADRSAYIREERRHLTIRERPEIGGLQTVQARLRSLPKPPTMQQSAQKGSGSLGSSSGSSAARTSQVTIERPSSSFRTFEQDDG